MNTLTDGKWIKIFNDIDNQMQDIQDYPDLCQNQWIVLSWITLLFLFVVVAFWIFFFKFSFGHLPSLILLIVFHFIFIFFSRPPFWILFSSYILIFYFCSSSSYWVFFVFHYQIFLSSSIFKFFRHRPFFNFLCFPLSWVEIRLHTEFSWVLDEKKWQKCINWKILKWLFDEYFFILQGLRVA